MTTSETVRAAFRSAFELAHIEPEFERPCEDCSNKAEWIAYASHTRYQGCPGVVFQCDQHKQGGEKHWAWVVTLLHARCDTCRGVITGNLSDNLRFIKL